MAPQIAHVAAGLALVPTQVLAKHRVSSLAPAVAVQHYFLTRSTTLPPEHNITTPATQRDPRVRAANDR